MAKENNGMKGENAAGLLFRKTNVLRLDLMESREHFFWRGKARSFHV